MKNIIQKIFQNKGYIKNISSTEKILFYAQEDQEYFLITEYSKIEIQDFFKSEKTNNLINFFDTVKKSDIEKNTSLIILLKLDSLQEREESKLKNQIFKIEEDEYFFRKYVITYTENAVTELEKIGSLDEKGLSKKLEENGKFDKFQKNNLEDEAYFLLIQIFVKLPFLVFHSTQDDNFKSLESILAQNEKIDTEFKNKIFSGEGNFEKLEQDFLSEEIQDDKIALLQTFSPEKNEN